MFKKKDPNSFTRYFNIFDGTPALQTATDPGNQIGYLVADYQVVNYEDVQAHHNDSWEQNMARYYILHCTQRVVLFNPDMNTIPVFEPGSTPYENYPALFNTSISLKSSVDENAGDFSIQVLDYAPKTLNTTVQSSGSTGSATGDTQSTSSSTTVGSSTSQTNSYGSSVTLGGADMGDFFSVSGSVTESSDHSSTVSSDQSSSQGNSSSVNHNSNASESSSMSIKDWGTYAFVNPVAQSPTWILGQEYPWDAIMCRGTLGTLNPNNKDQVQLILPQEMLNRLYDPQTQCLLPPSQLSVFGVNFLMKAAWLIQIGGTDAPVNTDIIVTHSVNYSSASHSLAGSTPAVYIDQSVTALQTDSTTDNDLTTTLNLPIMALTVLGQPHKPAIIGFSSNKFDVLPYTNPFRITSSANTLLIEDSTTYSPYPSSPLFTVANSALTATFTPTTVSASSISAYFKVVDTVNDYKLYLKHWVVGAVGVVLTITINGDTANQITKYVTAAEAEGGENNLMAITLRNQDFSSVDYHDYLQLGLNCIEISIAPNGTLTDSTTCVYQVRAMSVEKI